MGEATGTDNESRDRRLGDSIDSQRLEVERALLAIAIDQARESIVITDPSGAIQFVNPAFERQTGNTRAEVIGQNPRILQSGAHSAEFYKAMWSILALGETWRGTFVNRARDGRLFEEDATISPVFDAGGKLIHYVAVKRDVTSEREAAQVFRQSEEQFRTIFNSVGDGVAISNPGGEFLEVNRSFCDRLGYTREQLLTMPVSAINTAESAATIPSRVDELMRGGDVPVIEATHVRRDGTEISIEAVSCRMDFHGRPAILSVYRDITERKRAEEEHLAHLRFAESMDRVNRAILGTDDLDQMMRDTLDAVLELLDCDRAWLFYPCDPDAPSFRVPMEVTKPGYPGAGILNVDVPLSPDLSQNLREALESADPLTYVAGTDKPINKVSAEQFGVQSQMFTALYPKSGKPWAFGIHQCSHPRVWTSEEEDLFKEIGRRLTDALTSLLARRDLQRSEEEYRRIVDTASEGIWVVGPDAATTFVNARMADMMGFPSNEMMGRPVTDFMFEEDVPDHLKRVENSRRGVTENYERRFHREDGKTVWTQASAAPILDDDHQYQGSFAMFTDITERAALEEQLRQSQKMEAIGRLAGGIAHDFNNLLTVIRGNASLALSELPAGENLREDIEQIEQASNRAAALTRQLLAFARRTVLRPEVVDLGSIVRNVAPMLRRLIGEDVRLITITPDGAGSVLADPGQIEQVIVNLAVNARDAMPHGGTLTIETADSTEPSLLGRMTTLSVTDTGVGMDAETRGRIFEPFFTTKGPGKGTGLGLATVYGIIRQSGGIVLAGSKPGEGSRFTVYLPRVEAAASAPAPQPSSASVTTGRGTILVVEDDSGVRRFASRVLEAAGYRVLVASSGERAVETAAAGPLDLLLTDMVMPGMSGPEVASRLRTAQPGIPVLYMSGHTDKGIVTDGVLIPGIELLAKPFTTVELLEAVGRLIDEPVAD